MQYYKTQNTDELYAYEDGVNYQDYTSEDLVVITKEEYDALMAPTFIQLQEAKISQLKQKRDESNTLPVIVNVTDITTSTTVDYNFYGGYESAQMLDGKRNLVKESFVLGLVADDNVSFRDTSDVQLLMSMADATKVVLTVANAYEINFNKYKDLKAQVLVATTQSELDLIVW